MSNVALDPSASVRAVLVQGLVQDSFIISG
jgi:hypothetical protein